MNPNPITPIIGLDIDKVPVRLIYAYSDNDNQAVPYVLESRQFKTLAGLWSYWRRYCSNKPNLRVAVPASSPDPLGVIPWLEKHNVTVERYSWLAYRSHLNGDFSIWELPTVFERAYTLALYAAYRLHGLSVARLLCWYACPRSRERSLG